MLIDCKYVTGNALVVLKRMSNEPCFFIYKNKLVVIAKRYVEITAFKDDLDLKFNMAFIVPKNSSAPSPSGSMAKPPKKKEKKEKKARGSSEKKGQP